MGSFLSIFISNCATAKVMDNNLELIKIKNNNEDLKNNNIENISENEIMLKKNTDIVINVTPAHSAIL
tara:strand:- start:149 stop:352 length:204 start_codon:yes stop_codon:yes gene_type:complete